MKIQTIAVLAAALLLGGCMNNGKGPAAASADAEANPTVTLEPYQGPAGGGNLDQTWPVEPASNSPDGNTASAFPKGVPPG